MKVKLKDIVSIQTGFFGRHSIHPEVLYIQVKNFDKSGIIEEGLLPELAVNKIANKHFLQEGDILFAAKGRNNFATIFKQTTLPAVASTSFFVIKLSKKEILPEYLAWYLNEEQTLNYLQSNAEGTSMISISKKMLEQLEIELPPLEKQKIILKIVALKEKQKNIYQRIIELEENRVQQLIYNSIK